MELYAFFFFGSQKLGSVLISNMPVLIQYAVKIVESISTGSIVNEYWSNRPTLWALSISNHVNSIIASLSMLTITAASAMCVRQK